MRMVKNVRRRSKRTGALQEGGCGGSTVPALPPNPPIAARVTWRVFEPGNGPSSFDLVHTETALEREALTAFRDLRHGGRPVVVSRWQIYRVQIEPKTLLAPERFAFVETYSADDACARVAATFASIYRCPFVDVRLRVSAKSYEECQSDGVSEDLEIRLFEVAWTNGRVAEWVREPVFLLPEPSVLTRKWAQVPEGAL
jgi:hypothetical protein